VQRQRGIVACVFAGIVVVALGVRLWGLDANTLTHEEIYVPGLSMPAYVSAPPPRSTLAQTLSGTLHHDNHPPAYYAAMWFWDAAVGTGLFALRLPSALAGAATVALLFLLVRRRDGAWTALTAAALLALHGHHVFWSQRARMWVFLGALAVLSLLLLESLARRYRPRVAAAYVAVVALGLWTEYSFWPFVLAQIGYEAARRDSEPRLPVTLELLYFCIVAASPVMSFLTVHVGLERTGYLAEAGLLDHLGGFLSLQWLLRGPAPGAVYGPVASLAVLALMAAGVVFLAVGLWPRKASRDRIRAVETSPPRGLALASAAVPSAAMFAWWVSAERSVAVLAGAVLPWCLLAAHPLVVRAWPAVAAGLRVSSRRAAVRRFLGDPVGVHTLVPLVLLLALSLLVPSVAARSLLFLTPFALWAVARGLAHAVPSVAPRLVVTAILGVGFAASIAQHTRTGMERWDYQSLARVLRPEVVAGDVLLIRDAWYTQPMHYYFPPDRYRTARYEADLSAAATNRVWVIVLDAKDAEAWNARPAPLRGYAIAHRVEAGGAYAVLLVPATRAAGAPTGSDSTEGQSVGHEQVGSDSAGRE